MTEKDDIGRRLFALLLLAALCAGLSFSLYLYFQKGFYAISPDDSYRTIDAYRWLHERDQVSTVWLPGHRVLVGAALKIRPDLIVTPRVINTLLGLGCLLVTALITRDLFGSRRVAVVSAFLGVVYPARVVLGAVALADMLFIFLVLAAVAFMTSWLSSDGRRAFLLAALFFALAATVRYEGWVLGGCFFLIAALRIIGRRRGLKERAASLIPAAVILLAFPLYWAGSHLRDPQGTLGFLHSTAQQYLQFHAATLGNLIHHNPAVQFLVENSRSMTLVGLIPVAGMVSVNERVRTWVLVPGASLVLISACSFFLKGMPSHDFWRVPAAWGVLLLPFTAYWIVQYGGGLMRTPHTGRAFLLLLVLIPSLLQCKEMTRVSELTRHELALGRKLDQVLTEGGSETERRVLLETSSWKFIHVLVASQHPFSFVLNTGKYADAPRRPILNPAVGLDIRDLAARGVRFLVFKSQAYISLLDEAPEARRMGDFGLWVLYRLEAERDPWDRAAPQRPGRPSALTGSPAAASLPAGH